MDEKARDRELANDVRSAERELRQYLIHRDRSTEDRQQQRWELAKRAAPLFDAVAAARESGLTVDLSGNDMIITIQQD